jgi:hypothetical protein
MQLVEELDSGTIERLGKQDKLLLRIYQAELAKDPSSKATESSRSNVIAHSLPAASVTRFPFNLQSCVKRGCGFMEENSTSRLSN